MEWCRVYQIQDPHSPDLKFENEKRNVVDIVLFPKSYAPGLLIVLNTNLWLKHDKALETALHYLITGVL
jgi:hypothetical protein